MVGSEDEVKAIYSNTLNCPNNDEIHHIKKFLNHISLDDRILDEFSQIDYQYIYKDKKKIQHFHPASHLTVRISQYFFTRIWTILFC